MRLERLCGLWVGFLVLFVLVFGRGVLYSQDSLRRYMDYNQLNVMEKPDKRTILPYRLQPALSSEQIKTAEDSLKRTKSSISKAIFDLNNGNLSTALFYIHDALTFCPKNEVRAYAIATSYYGLIQIKAGNYSKAAKALNSVDTVFRALDDLYLLAFHNNNLGIFARKFTNIKIADSCFNRSLLLSRVIDDKAGIAKSLNYLSTGNASYERKTAYLNEAIDINKRGSDIHSLAENYINLAKLLSSAGNYSKAHDYLDLSYNILKESKPTELIVSLYETRSKTYSLQGLFQKAYESLLLANSIKESLADKGVTGDIEEVIQSRVISKINYELDIQKKESNIRRLTLILTIAVSLFVLLLIVSSYIYYVITNRRKMLYLRSKQIIIEKEKELIDNELVNVATYMNSRSEMLENIQNSLSRAYKLPENEIAQEVRKINIYIRNLQTTNEDVESVMKKIEKINRSFIVKLSKLHPNLTKNDKKIALLLRANLSTKQISTLMDCSPKSVNMARYRMRTNMGISSEINLVSYLKSL